MNLNNCQPLLVICRANGAISFYQPVTCPGGSSLKGPQPLGGGAGTLENPAPSHSTPPPGGSSGVLGNKGGGTAPQCISCVAQMPVMGAARGSRQHSSRAHGKTALPRVTRCTVAGVGVGGPLRQLPGQGENGNPNQVRQSSLLSWRAQSLKILL